MRLTTNSELQLVHSTGSGHHWNIGRDLIFTLQTLRDALAVEVALDTDALDVVAGRRTIAVV
jgi:hypothetical protein